MGTSTPTPDEDGLRFRVLGRMQGRRGDVALSLGSPQQQAVLAVLLLRPGHVTDTDYLIDALWCEDPPTHARAALRTYVWRLRKALNAVPGCPSELISVHDGYRLELPGGAVDSVRAQELADQAERSRRDDQSRQARDLLGRALTLWQGEPLAGVPGAFAERHRRRLGEFQLALLEERIGLDLALGQAAHCVAELSALAAEHPLREGFHALLMRALAQTGRQAEALEVFRKARRLLVDEVGVEPGPDLLALHSRILDGDPELIRPTAPDRVLVASRSDEENASLGPDTDSDPQDSMMLASPPLPVPAQLPLSESDFTGRKAVVQDLCAGLTAAPSGLVERCETGPRIAAVAGMGGVGKSVLALHVAHLVKNAFPDGQLYANLRGGADVPVDPMSVVGGFLQALGVRPQALPDDLEVRSALFRSMAEGRRLLVVLDDVRDAAQIRALLPGSTGCAVIVTSRMRLAGMATDVSADLGVFEFGEAMDLLGHVIGAERLAAGQDDAADLVAACGYLPLAVRIVAARLAARPSWNVGDLLHRLADERRRMEELRAGDLSVGATFEVGYQQLDRAQAAAFRKVAAVDGPGLSLTSAAALLGVDEHSADALLETLADVAMLESPAARRYRHHDLLRAFARRKAELEHPEEAASALGSLLDHLLATACAAFQLAVPGDPVGGVLGAVGLRPLPLADREAAQTWVAAEVEGALILVEQIAAERIALGRMAEAGSAAEATATETLRRGVNLLIALSPFGSASRRHQWVETARSLVRAGELAGDRYVERRARFLHGNIATAAAWLAEAEYETRLAVGLCRDDGDTVILRQALNDLGLLAQFGGCYDEAVRHYDEATVLAHELGHASGATATALNAAVARVRSGHPAEAAVACEVALRELRAREDRPGIAHALYVWGLALHESGRHREAAEKFTESMDLWIAIGPPGREGPARYRLADSLRALGEPEQALQHARQALQACDSTGSDRDRGHALMVLARVLGALGRTDEARHETRQALDVYTRLGLPEAAEAAAQLSGSTTGWTTGDGPIA